MKIIDAEKLAAELEIYEDTAIDAYNPLGEDADFWHGKVVACEDLKNAITSLHQEQLNMIQWNGSNLKEVIDFTGKSPRFGEWFKSWEDYENYVHTHNDILKLFCEDGSHYEVPVGAWIVKTPDGYNLPSVAKYIQQEQPEVDLEKEINSYCGTRDIRPVPDFMDAVARHFYELGKARKK